MRKLFFATALALLVSPGLSIQALAQSAQPAQPQQQQPAKPAKDPNEIVCEKQVQLGSRLATQRVCKTRSQWAEERLQNRQDVEKAQLQRDLNHPQ